MILSISYISTLTIDFTTTATQYIHVGLTSKCMMHLPHTGMLVHVLSVQAHLVQWVVSHKDQNEHCYQGNDSHKTKGQ